MIKNYLKIALRNLWKRKLFSGINIMGMAVAIGCSILLLITVIYEFSFDKFHEKGDRLYQVYMEELRTRGVENTANMPGPFRDALLEEVPQVEAAVRYMGSSASVEYGADRFSEGIRFVDKEFFDLFSFPLIKGQKSQALADLNGVVLTENSAKRIFGEEDPIGKNLKVIVQNDARNLVVTGVLANFPENSTLRLNLLTRIENYPSYNSFKQRWNDLNHSVFVLAKENVTGEDLSKASAVVVDKYLQEEVETIRKDGAAPDKEGRIIRYGFLPFEQLHFDTRITNNGINKAFPIGLLIIGLFILSIACINFVNLTLGSSLTRAREVGVRKVLGATRRMLLGQFWGEAFIVIIMALIAGLSIAQWLLPEYNAIFRRSLSLFNPNLIAIITLIVLMAGLLGGAYPALVLSRFQAAEVLKGNTKVQRPGRMRNLLLVVQFALSILLISCTIIISQQLNFLRNKPLGYNENQVLSIPLGNELDGEKLAAQLRNELAGNPRVKSVTASYNNLGMGEDGSRRTSVMTMVQEEKQYATHWNQVDLDYFKTLEIPIVSGRAFSSDHPTDTTEAIIINETFARELGEENPVGMMLELNPPRKVIGIMKDHHFKSLTEVIKPQSVVLGDDNGFRFNYIFIRIDAQEVPATMKDIEQSWKALNPKSVFLASMLNENTDRQYKSEEVIGKIFISAAVLAILLSCMGLFGVAVLVINQRTKEIGIRKILGASVRSIVALVSREFLIMVGIGLVIATPPAWYAMKLFLEQYAYRISLHWWVFLLAGLLAVLVAFLTLSLQSIKAARMNPVNTLRAE